jgi:IS605 OrfB family transposase
MGVQAFRFALDPGPRQVRDLARHAGAARFAFNWALARVKANLSQRDAERSYGIAETDLTPAVSWTLYSLRKEWNQAKYTVAPWWPECSKEAYNTGLDQVSRALKNFAASRSGKRKGPKMGFPKFRSRNRTVPTVRFTTGAIRVEPDRRHVVLPVLGRIRTHENTRKLERKIATGTARVLSATVKFERGRWFVSFTVEMDRPARVPGRPDAVIGVDLGVRNLAVLSDGTMIPNPKRYDAARRKLARASRTVSRRQGPDRRTGQASSNRWKKANKQRNRVHHKVAYQRADELHKLTTGLAREYGTVVVEDLNVTGMLRLHTLAARVQDASFGEIRRQLAYKTQWNGGCLVVADRWFPSSKTCSRCKMAKPKLSLSERVFNCEACGLVIDRDVNAAVNLHHLVQRQFVAGSAPGTLNGRGAGRKTVPGAAGGCETSIPHPAPSQDQTGSFTRQRANH